MMKQEHKDTEQERFERAEKDLKVKLVEFTERQEIQSQTAEAFYIWKDDPNMIIEFRSEEDIDDHTFTRFMDWFMFDFMTFDTRKRVVQLFYEHENENLPKVEQQLLSDWMKSFQAFYELEEKNGINCTLKDIFTGERLIVTDKNASTNAEISDILFARPLKTGNKYYFSGAVSIYPNIFKQTILEYLNQEFEEYKKSGNDSKSRSGFLRDWSYIVSNRIEDVVKHPQFLTKDGEEFVISTAKYRPLNEEKLALKLNGDDNIKEITDSISGFKAFLLENKKDGYSANIELDEDVFVVKCNSRKKLEKARAYIQRLAGDTAEHIEDTYKELNSFVKKNGTQGEKKEQLPSNNISEDELHHELDRYYENWIVTPLEALGGITPLDAMESDQGKEKLENVLKELESIYEHARKVGEPYYDIRKLRDKLRERSS